ncbi:MAG: valine--tRNA ligase [Nitrospinae bacterium]|nr:valine--tRNA ligase [Nitrospinota bacterium]
MTDFNKILESMDKEFDHTAVENRCRTLWEESGIHRYDPNKGGEVFSVDTPPPYVSAAHLHVGHAMSYSQAEFIIRFQRMKGKNIYYPMGFDDNGLPTERYVEQTHKINKRTISRADFIKLCLEETKKGAAEYEELWRALGLSVDWSLRYSTIDPLCRKTAQKSFIELFNKGLIYRANEPVLWDTHFETALSQADLDSLTRKTQLNDIAFKAPDGTALVISTTRPELLPGCVALYCNPNDERYKRLIGSRAIVPLFGFEVPVLADEEVLADFGTGLMMVCTFGDSDDVRRWKRDNLNTRICLNPDGRFNDLAGKYAGMKGENARKSILEDLKAGGHFISAKTVEQNVAVSERSGTPVEFLIFPQWFINVMGVKQELLERSGQLKWHPDLMKVRLDRWVEGLKYDWNISRQRFYGVPFPLWYCAKCGHPVLADEGSLPIDPTESPCPAAQCAQCGGAEFKGEADVMDTWMTSSLTPLINSRWADGAGARDGIYPMTVRVQAFEIIRTWLFYTLVKSHFHTGSLPWKNVMISGWGLNEQGKKISKRDLEQYTDAKGYNRYNPYAVVRSFGADALRYWSAGSNLGHDLKYSERDVKAGRKLVVKLWNVARLTLMNLGGFDPKAAPMPFEQRTPEDRWIAAEFSKKLPVIEKGFETYNFAEAREAAEKFFWMYCDDYLEMIKDRFWNPDRHDESARQSARWTLWEMLNNILGVFAPFIPFVTEEVYQKTVRPFGGGVSLHVSPFPAHWPEREVEVPEMKVLLAVLNGVRALRTQANISQSQQLAAVTIDMAGAAEEVRAVVKGLENSLLSVARTKEIAYGAAEHATGTEGVKVAITK